MSDNVSGLPRRGQTYQGENTITDASLPSQSVALEGMTKYFPDMAPGQGAGVKVRRSNRMTKCVLVRNVAGFALLPKMAVTWASGYRGTRVDGRVDVSYEAVAGIVDEHISSAGVPDNHLFWLAVSGPSICKVPVSATEANIAAGDVLVGLTAATNNATTAGRVFTAATTMYAHTAVDGIVGVAMSAKTTADTNSDILVDLCCFKTNN